jgi:hypothetical protein
MEELKRDIEQLYEAGQQLRKLTSTGARLALFLMDNAAELFMYRTALQHLEWDKTWHRPPRYSSQKRYKFLEYFNEKVNFLTNETKRLSQTEANVLKLGHRLRNEAYHRGILRESIILAVASVYYEVVCNLHPHMWVGHCTVPQDKEEIPRFFRKYGFEVTASWIDPALLAKLSDVFLEGCRFPILKLSELLSNDLDQRLEQAVQGVEYIAQDGRTPDDVLKHIQFYDQFWSKHRFPHTDEGARQSFEAWEAEYKKYCPPVKVEDLLRWKHRASILRAEMDLGLLILKFDQLDLQLLPIEGKITAAVVAYDMHIDAEVTRAKEER